MSARIMGREEADIYEQYEAALFRAAFYEIEREELEALSQEPVDGVQLDAFFARTQAGTLRMIERRLGREHRREFLHRTLPKAAQIAAALLLAFFITATVAVAAVPAVRVRVLELLIRIHNDHAELSLAENPVASFEVPEGWHGDYYPSFIPEGYQLDKMDSEIGISDNFLSYKNTQGLSISYNEATEDEVMDIDTEGAQIVHIIVHGHPAILSTKTGWGGKPSIHVAWAESNRYFIIWTQIDAQTTTAIANGVLRIDK